MNTSQDRALNLAPEIQAQLVNACKMAYRKHHMLDESIGWGELSEAVCDALANALGPAFQDEMNALEQGQ